MRSLKTLVSLLLCFAILASMMIFAGGTAFAADIPTGFEISAEEYPEAAITDNSIGLVGDADLGGAVNIKDVTTIQKTVAKLITLDDLASLLSDVNFDGTVNIKDATNIQKYLAKFEIEFVNHVLSLKADTPEAPTEPATFDEGTIVVTVPDATADEPSDTTTTSAVSTLPVIDVTIPEGCTTSESTQPTAVIVNKITKYFVNKDKWTSVFVVADGKEFTAKFEGKNPAGYGVYSFTYNEGEFVEIIFTNTHVTLPATTSPETTSPLETDPKETTKITEAPAETDPKETTKTTEAPLETDPEETTKTTEAPAETDPKETTKTTETPAETDPKETTKTTEAPAETDPKETTSPTDAPVVTEPEESSSAVENTTVESSVSTEASTTVEASSSASTEPSTTVTKSDFVIHGEFYNNNWGDLELYINSANPNVASASIELAKGEYEFVIHKTGVQEIWLKNPSTIKDSCDGLKYEKDGGNTRFEASGGKYTFAFNVNTYELTITKENVDDIPKPEDNMVNIYLSVNTHGWKEVYAYAWNSSDDSIKNAQWPGVKMEVSEFKSNGDSSLYVITVDSSKYDMIVFSNGSSDNQTVDIRISEVAATTETLRYCSVSSKKTNNKYEVNIRTKNDSFWADLLGWLIAF